jgi:hypothetical protein
MLLENGHHLQEVAQLTRTMHNEVKVTNLICLLCADMLKKKKKWSSFLIYLLEKGYYC